MLSGVIEGDGPCLSDEFDVADGNLVSSDVFNDRILANIPGALDLRTLTNYGVILQGIFFVIGFIILEILVDQKII